MRKKEDEGLTVIIKFSATRKNALIVQQRLRHSTCNSVCAYQRSVVLKQPVTAYCRNKSADELLLEMIEVNLKLKAIYTVFNQVLQQVHTGEQKPESDDRLMMLEENAYQLEKKIETIRLLLVKNYESCS